MIQKTKSSWRAVTTMSPLRVSFAGGGTDIASYYANHGGAVVSSAIDQYVYVTVKRHSPLFAENYRLSYSKTEHCEKLDDIENDIARECLRFIHIDPPVFISTAADLPALSGLGSSSSFAVGLLYALHAIKGEEVSAGQLAEEACHIEIDVLKRPIGKQDQYAAAFGGLNHITFEREGRVQLDPLWVPNDGIAKLFRSSMLFWTGQQREASGILADQVTRITQSDADYGRMREMASVCRDQFLSGSEDFTRLAGLLDEGWRIKRGLARGVSNNGIDRWYELSLAAGALGGKLLGAGGGGFLYLLVPAEVQQKVRVALSDLVDVHIGYEPRGARILSVVAE
jgi:D-glycero-alpha-D-manno-heptose-7-phosphate kinase